MKVRCEVCGAEFKSIVYSHLKSHNLTMTQYRTLYPNAKLSSDKTRNLISLGSEGKKTGDDNPAKRNEVRQKISNTVKSLWNEGKYDNRINGMFGKVGELNPKYKYEIRNPLVFAENNYREFLELFQDVNTCSICGKSAINVHHVDEDHKNFLISNLEPLCRPCHSSLHYKLQKMPFVKISKEVSFSAAHRLPNHDGLCSKWHGHEWKLKLSIMKRINQKTSMVMDFKLLNDVLEKHILQKFDHSVLNDFIEIPTVENLLINIWEILMFEGLLKGIQSIELYESSTNSAILNKECMMSIFYSNINNYLTKEIIDQIEKNKSH